MIMPGFGVPLSSMAKLAASVQVRYSPYLQELWVIHPEPFIIANSNVICVVYIATSSLVCLMASRLQAMTFRK